MVEGLIWFVAGGYLIPAIFFAGEIWEGDRKNPDEPTIADSLATAVLGGLTWPLIIKSIDLEDQ